MRVLVVEDELKMASLIRRGLRDEGLLADVAVKGEDALWMARYSAELYARLEEETGLATGFRQCGYLQLATTPRADESLRRETAYMRSMGMTKEVLSPREVADLVPLMRTDDVVHGFWTPDEGRANPVDVTMSLAKGARQRGARCGAQMVARG